jgi:RNA polymerase sigma-70 factor (ECF subfamily)
MPWRAPPAGRNEEPAPEGEGDRLTPLVESAQAGDLDAWSTLYSELFDGLYRHVCYMTGAPALAEDLVQETFAKAMVSVDSFEEKSSFTTWLHGIAVNLVRMHWRRKGVTRRARERLDEVERTRADQRRQTPDDAHLRSQRLQVLYDVLATLPEHLREAFIMRDLEGLAPAEAAQELGITSGNLAVRAHRARTRIRDELERLGWLSEEGGA